MVNDRRVLDFGVWGYDETDYRVLDNRMRVTRRPHDCAICFETIPVGSRVRAQSEVLLEDHPSIAKTFYFCPTCCAAMVADRDGLAIEERYEVGRTNAERVQS